MQEAYRIGVMIAMSSNAEAVLGAIGGRLMGLRREIGLTEAQLKTLGVAAAGAVAVFVGYEVVKGVWRIIDAGKDLNRELEKTKQLGGDFAKTIDATRASAFNTQQLVPTSTAAGNVRMQRELATQLSHPEAANEILPFATKAAYVASNYTGEDVDKMIKNLVRIADDRAQIFVKDAQGNEHVDQAKLVAELNAAVKGLILGGNYITSQDLLQEVRQAGPAAKQQTPEAFYAAGVEAAIMLGGAKTGTAEMSLFQQFIGGTMTKRIAENLTHAGILHPGDWHSGRSGGVVVNPKVAGRFGELVKDPEKYFAEGEGAQKIAKFAAENAITPMMAVFQLFGRQTVERLISDFITNKPQFERARAIFGGIDSVEKQYKTLMGEDLQTNIIALQSSWTSFMQALGEPGVPIAIHILQDLTGVIQGMEKWAAANPGTAKMILEVAAAIGVGVAVGGAVTLVAAIAMLAGPAAGVAAAAAGIAALGTAILLFGDRINAVVASIDALIPKLPDFLKPPTLPDGSPVPIEGTPQAREADRKALEEQWKKMQYYREGNPRPLPPPITAPPALPPMNPWAPHYVPPLDRLQHPERYPPPAGAEHSSYTPAGSQPLHLATTNNIYLDGRLIATNVVDRIENGFRAAPTGSPNYDIRSGITHPGPVAAA